MLRKKEKKAITSIIALLIGWPVGLDQFLEKNNGKGFQSLIGWLITGLLFLFGIGTLGTGSDAGFSLLFLSALGGLVGFVCILIKLVNKLRAFEEAED